MGVTQNGWFIINGKSYADGWFKSTPIYWLVGPTIPKTALFQVSKILQFNQISGLMDIIGLSILSIIYYH